MSNAYPAIPDPQNNVESLGDTVRALKMAVETLAGHRAGGMAARVFEQVSEPTNPRGGDIWLVSNDAGTIRVWNGYFWLDVANAGGGDVGQASSLSTEALTTITDTINPELEALKAQAAAAFAETAKVTKELNKQIDIARSEFQDIINGVQTEALVNIQSSSATSYAQILTEAGARADADTALGVRIDSTNAAVANNAAAITTEQGVRATKDTALAGFVTKVSAGASGVYVQDTTPTGMVTGATWLKPSEDYRPYYYNGSTWLDNSNGVYPIGKVADLQAQVSTEVLSRTTADTALATYITRSSVGSGPVYVQNSTPSSPPVGAIWYSTANVNDPYRPYYWNGSSWLDNSSGTYGSVATISSSLSSVQNKVDNTLGVQWAVQANINNSTGGLTFTGIKKADGSGGTYTFEIDATWTKINGNCLITGSLGADKISTTTLSAIAADLGTITAGTIIISDSTT